MVLGPSPMFEALSAGATVVTGSRRLARSLHGAYGAFQQEQGDTVWPTPDILPWGAWLTRTAEACGVIDGVLPTETETLALWGRVIRSDRRDGEGHILVNPLARRLAATHATVQAWRISPDELAATGSTATQRFLDWRGLWLAELTGLGWSDPATLADRVADGPGLKNQAGVLWLAGLEELTRQQEDLIEALNAARWTVRRFSPAPAGGAANKVRLEDSDAELGHAIDWLADRLVEGARSVALVVPDLSARRDEVVRCLETRIAPRLQDAGSIETPPWNLSLGIPLADAPVIAAALNVLDLARGDADHLVAGRFLRSPWFHDEAERATGACADARLREAGQLRPGLGGLIKALGRDASAATISRRVAAIAELTRDWHRVLPSEWMGRFGAFLSTLAWPGPGSLDSASWQAHQSFQDCMVEVGRLDAVLGPVDLDEALSRLASRVKDRVFQARTPDMPLQVLGEFELAGLRFDAIWVLGMHDERWPAPPDPDPFLPRGLQMRLGLPHASPEREREFATRVTAGLKDSADRVIFSWPELDGDRPLRASPVLGAIAEVGIDTLTGVTRGSRALRQFAAPSTETWEDVGGSPLEAGSELRGGTSIFLEQGLCPFRGYARTRLRAVALESPDAGLDPATRGTLAHEALKFLWRDLGESSALRGLSTAELWGRIDAAVDEALERFRFERPDDRPLLEFERDRLTRLITELLALDMRREPFSADPERPESVELGGLRFRLQIDRIDRLADGRTVVVDYKTGTVSASEWFGSRPRAPQLPLYAVISDPVPDAVAFAILRAGEIGFQGVARSSDLLPEVEAYEGTRRSRTERDAPDWDSLLAVWRSRLEAIAAEVLAGEARVDPLDQACARCDLSSFCRIAETRWVVMEDGHD